MRTRLRLTLVGLTVLTAAGAALAAQRTDALVPAEKPSSQPAAAAAVAHAPAEPGPGYAGVIVPEATIELAAPIEARVARVEVVLGDRVAAGDVIAQLDDRTLRQELAAAKAELQRLSAEVAIAVVELAVATDIAERRTAAASAPTPAISSEQLADSRFAKLRAEHAVRAARARAGESRARLVALEQTSTEATVRAPFGAYVAARHIDPGAYVARGMPLVKLVAAAPPRVRFGVPVDRSAALALGTRVRVRVGGSDSAWTATVDRIAPTIDAAAHLLIAEASLDTPPRGLLGRRADVSVSW